MQEKRLWGGDVTGMENIKLVKESLLSQMSQAFQSSGKQSVSEIFKIIGYRRFCFIKSERGYEKFKSYVKN